MRNNQLEVDLLEHGPLSRWSPKVGDVIHKDGVFTRWCAVVTGLNGDKLSVRQSGNMALMVAGDYKELILNCRKVISSSMGSYYVVSGGTYYV